MVFLDDIKFNVLWQSKKSQVKHFKKQNLTVEKDFFSHFSLGQEIGMAWVLF